MQRTIVGFHQDSHGDWVAELGCGHTQHVRHKPPFWQIPWVLTPEGRNEKLGVEIACVLCDRFELPADAAPYKRTREFDQDSIPDGLRHAHSTRAGVWGVVHVVAGRLRYVVDPPLAGERVLDEANPGVVVPEVLHRVEPDGPVRFFVEFHRKPTS